MSVLAAVLTLVLLAAVIAVVSRPLRAARKPSEAETPQRSELQAAREAKYREIRDTELDYRTGKLSSEDFEAINGALRAEALEILDRLEALERETDDEQQVRTTPPPK
jgi:type II secretory pathway component PulM